MDRIILGDNPFFAVNHISDDKSMNQSIRFKDNMAIVKTLDYARDAGINTFMCTTHDRIGEICELLRDDNKYQDFKFYPSMPYAHKYANSITENGIVGTLKKYVPGSFASSIFKGGIAALSRDYISIMELLIDSEMKMFKGLSTPIIFLQNVITDLLLGLQMKEILVSFYHYIRKKYNAEAGFITMNYPRLLDALINSGVRDPIICTSINKLGFRMTGGRLLYERVLAERKCRVIAMQVFAGGALAPYSALEYITSLTGVDSILFGASSPQHIQETVSLISQFDLQYSKASEQLFS